MHCPEGAVEDDDVKLIWDTNIQCDSVIEARRPDLILVDKKAKSCVIIDVTIPGDWRIGEKEIEKIEKYQNLKRELKRFWSLKEVEVVEALGCISKGFSGCLMINNDDNNNNNNNNKTTRDQKVRTNSIRPTLLQKAIIQ